MSRFNNPIRAMSILRQFRPLISATLSLALLSVGASQAILSSVGKAVFIKGNEVVTAKDDGSDVRILVTDSVPKSHPVWSPDGQRIAYLVPGAKSSNPKAHGKIVIIDATGAPQTVVPVLSTEADGTFVEGMRFVEGFGWYGNNAVFATGTLNPHLAEYRILDVNSSKVIESYFGYQFETCAAQARVAYLAESTGTGSKGIHIEVQGTRVYPVPENSSIRRLQWSADCMRLAFLQVEGANTKLVLLHSIDHSFGIEMILPVRKDLADATIRPFGNSFVLSVGETIFKYDASAASFQPDLDLTDAFQKEKERRSLLIHRLGGVSPDWWNAE